MIQIDGLDEINKKLRSLDRDLAPELIKDVTKDAYKNIFKRAHKHYDTGNMERKIDFNVYESKLEGIIKIIDNGMMVDVKGSEVNYALFVLLGTKPHPIKPKEKKVLRYSSVGHFVFEKSKPHPGYKGDDFMKKGLQDTMDNLDSIIARIKDD